MVLQTKQQHESDWQNYESFLEKLVDITKYILET